MQSRFLLLFSIMNHGGYGDGGYGSLMLHQLLTERDRLSLQRESQASVSPQGLGILKLCKADEAKRKKISEMKKKNLKLPTSPAPRPLGHPRLQEEEVYLFPTGVILPGLKRPGGMRTKVLSSVLTFGSYLFSLIF